MSQFDEIKNRYRDEHTPQGVYWIPHNPRLSNDLTWLIQVAEFAKEWIEKTDDKTTCIHVCTGGCECAPYRKELKKRFKRKECSVLRGLK